MFVFVSSVRAGVCEGREIVDKWEDCGAWQISMAGGGLFSRDADLWGSVAQFTRRLVR